MELLSILRKKAEKGKYQSLEVPKSRGERRNPNCKLAKLVLHWDKGESKLNLLVKKKGLKSPSKQFSILCVRIRTLSILLLNGISPATSHMWSVGSKMPRGAPFQVPILSAATTPDQGLCSGSPLWQLYKQFPKGSKVPQGQEKKWTNVFQFIPVKWPRNFMYMLLRWTPGT